MGINKEQLRQFLSHIFENRSRSRLGKLLEQMLLLLIVTNVLFVMLETVDVIAQGYRVFLWRFEAVSVFIYTLEYIFRVWSCTSQEEYAGKYGRLKFISSRLMIFDLIVILPFYLQLLLPFNTHILGILRIVRICRILRIAPYSTAFDRIIAVVKKEKEELAAILEIMTIALLITSTLVYVAEVNVPNTQFTSIPASLWWGITTVTTLGYGDMVPVTILGKVFGGMAAVLGVGIFALPTGLLGASFYQEVTDRRERNIRQMRQELEAIVSYTEESGEKIDQFLARQQRKILRLEKELEDTQTKNERYREKIKLLKGVASDDRPSHN